MKTSKFKFEPKVNLYLANIRTVRELTQISERGGPFESEWIRFMKMTVQYLVLRKPSLRSWHFEKYDHAIDFYPGPSWGVLKDDTLALSLSYGDTLNPSIIGDAWVGLYVPANWKRASQFNSLLLALLKDELSDAWDTPEEEWPIWSWIKLDRYANGRSFDTSSFVSETTEKLLRLINMKIKIDAALRQVKRR